MLFTRCPECQTTFRISADTLRVASGAVRCGNCATIFSAYSGLRQERLDEPVEGHDEFLSPPLQTQELARTEDIESPALSDEDWEISVTEDDEAPAGEMIVLETLGDGFAAGPDERREPTFGDEGEIIVFESAGDEPTEDLGAEPAPATQPAARTDAPHAAEQKSADAGKPRAAGQQPAAAATLPDTAAPSTTAVPPMAATPPQSSATPSATATPQPPATSNAAATPQPPAPPNPAAPPRAPDPPTVTGERPRVGAAAAVNAAQSSPPIPAAGEPPGTGTGEDHEPLEIESQVDEWAELLKAIEASVTEPERTPVAEPSSDVSDATDDDESDEPEHDSFDEADLGEILSIGEDDHGDDILAVGEPGEPPGDDGPAPWNVGEPALPSESPAATARSAAPPKAPVRPLTERAAKSVQRPVAATLPDDEPDSDTDDDADDDAAISAEEIDATLSADPSPDILAALEAGLSELPDGEPISRSWSIASAALAIVLCVQLIHHNRDSLANQPVIGPAVATAYGLLGRQLFPAWDLRQYEITNWAATAGAGESATGSLRISAQIRNDGPAAQPYPSLKLELKDRWDAVIGSRVFTPGEYLAPGFNADGLMLVGVTVPADIAIVDPGLDASGFELDVCLETGADQLSCASDQVFR